MAQEWTKAFYTSTVWKKCREGYIQSVHGLCERCQAPGYIVYQEELLTPGNTIKRDVNMFSEIIILAMLCGILFVNLAIKEVVNYICSVKIRKERIKRIEKKKKLLQLEKDRFISSLRDGLYYGVEYYSYKLEAS